MALQVILGSGGAIGAELANVLKSYTDRVRLVSRSPQKVSGDEELYPGDLLDPAVADGALQGADVAYLTAGLPYRLKVWREQWPKLMGNVIAACKRHGTRLVFFDNMYPIDVSHIGQMTEESPVNPPSRKGKVRAQVDQMLLDEVARGDLQAIIARSADFYGPGITGGTSVLLELTLKNMKNGKPANWFCSFDKKHSFTYTPDAARATAILGNDPSAYNQIWHLPTAHDPLTGGEWIDLFARELGVAPRKMLVPTFMIKAMGIFNPLMRELGEMLYQYDRDYIFDSTKFEKAYDFTPTPYPEGARRVVQGSTAP
ncbi:MAG: NAD-dependent epimerase/dehydratase family protein [Cyclobacteriaceae bacterium]|jgi:nucleoside-diphosphate-sugar epimerase|nr:NAD-dependent epimerase/dehydratase family protein [Cyclobacteriaceae bacterium]